LKDCSTFRNWVKKQEDIFNNYNFSSRNISINYYNKLIQYKYDLEKFRSKVEDETKNLINFKNLAGELNEGIRKQKAIY
jgi:hypothetical protein